ncbi:MAG: DUF115 domain-containing protein [Synoicihabitans sp.]
MRNSYYIRHPRVALKKIISRFRARSDISFWKARSGLYAGRKVFVIGNGPSLKAADLNVIEGEISIASNRINLIYDECSWRPTFHTVVDPLVWEKYSTEIQQNAEYVCIPSMLPSALSDNVKVFRYLRYDVEKNSNFSSDLSVGAYGGHTVTFQNIELAVHLGAKYVYLLGCDHYYSGEEDIVENKPVVHALQLNHFSNKYRSEGEKVNPAPIKKMEKRYMDAKLACDALGVSVFNCTRGGHLDVFPRLSLEDALL